MGGTRLAQAGTLELELVTSMVVQFGIATNEAEVLSRVRRVRPTMRRSSSCWRLESMAVSPPRCVVSRFFFGTGNFVAQDRVGCGWHPVLSVLAPLVNVGQNSSQVRLAQGGLVIPGWVG